MLHQSGNIPVIEVYWSLVEKADKKFSKIRDLPYYERNRFLMVCLVLNRRDMVHQLVTQLKLLVDECKRTFQDADFKEWKLVLQEIARFVRADTVFLNVRPLRYSLVLDPHPDSLPRVAKSISLRNLRLRDAIMSSYHHNEVKFSELSLDTFRMLQCLEWEPSGSFYQSSGTKIGQNGGPGPIRVNHSQDIADPTLPANPRKALLYRPSVTHFLAVLATLCEELPPDGVLLIYLSSSGFRACMSATENIVSNAPFLSHSHTIYSDSTSTSPPRLQSDNADPASRQSKGECTSNDTAFLYFGTRGDGGFNGIYPSDLIPFTRRPLFVVIDSVSSEAFKSIHGAEKGDPAALLLSPSCSISITAADPSHQLSGSLFTNFLTAPLQAFCLLLGLSGQDIEMDTYNKADKLLSSSLNNWGVALATTDTLDPVWGQVLGDPFLRRLLLRGLRFLGHFCSRWNHLLRAHQ
ncbi:hypothetical protein HS088_TW04G01231 [Tripterygium wilfordii]|uniref:Protein SCAI n=1 Tax=Tripterygium wilfordii TaxID=458696 RepID=A0A7J7DT09_TRIWF|nr:hypothetical protein HS088_TW04G01231 [Tripterygium wilfordii]